MCTQVVMHFMYSSLIWLCVQFVLATLADMKSLYICVQFLDVMLGAVEVLLWECENKDSKV